MEELIGREMQRRVQDGFILLISEADAVCIFVEELKLSLVAEVPQAHRRPHLILNLSKKIDKVAPSVNNTTSKEVAPESMQFRRALPPHPIGDLGGRS